MLHSRSIRLLLLLSVMLGFTNLIAEVANLEELKEQGYSVSSSQNSISNVKSLSELQNWFTCRQMELYQKNVANAYRTGSPDLLIPVGVYRVKKNVSLKSRWETRITYEAFSLWSTNIGIGYNRQLNDKWSVTPYGTLGGGQKDVEFGSNTKTPMEFNFGLGAEVGYNLSNKLVLLGGALYSWLTPNALEATDPGDLSNGTGISIYAGGKYYLSAKKDFSLNLNVGQHFWSGFDYTVPGVATTNIMPPNFYVQGGFSMYRSASMAKVLDNKWRPVEVGLFWCPTLSTANLKILAPYAIREELSIAPFINYGRELKSNCPSISGAPTAEMIYSAAAGLEVRLFGKNLEKYVNPYIGAALHHNEYQTPMIIGTDLINVGTGWSAYIGTRVKILGNLAFDANVGRAFWWGGFPTTPDDMMINVGFVLALGKKDKTEELKLHGTVLTKKIDAGEPLPNVAQCDPLSEDMLDDYDGEIRTYVYREAESTIFGNLTDLSFIDYFGTGFKFQDTELLRETATKQLEFLINRTVKQSPKKVVVMLNKEQIDIDKLKRAELYLCFTNYDKNRYFGYYYDDQGALQPEYLTNYSLGDMVEGRSNPQNVYMGSFGEYAATLDWVDNYRDESGGIITPYDVKNAVLSKFMAFNGMDAEDLLLKQQLLRKYDFAYAVCDTGIINNIKEYLNDDNLGYAVLAAKDFNKNGLFIKNSDGVLGFDEKDDFVYSNHEKADKFVKKDDSGDEPEETCIESASGNLIGLDEFEECDTNLTPAHMQHLENYKADFLDAKKIIITGHADKSVPTKECLEKFKEGNPAIAMGRAVSVAHYLQDIIEVNTEIINLAIGEMDPNEPECPTCRKVTIHIISQ
jgi:hypothetical protein